MTQLSRILNAFIAVEFILVNILWMRVTTVGRDGLGHESETGLFAFLECFAFSVLIFSALFYINNWGSFRWYFSDFPKFGVFIDIFLIVLNLAMMMYMVVVYEPVN